MFNAVLQRRGNNSSISGIDCIKHKCRNSYVLYIPSVHASGSLLLTHTLLVQTHIHDVSTPCFESKSFFLQFFVDILTL